MSDMDIREEVPAVIIQAMYHPELLLPDIVGEWARGPQFVDTSSFFFIFVYGRLVKNVLSQH
jgi:hypothetical protein